MILRRAAPDGTQLTVRWLPGHGRWEVRRTSEFDWYESRDLTLALVAATGDRYAADAYWIRAIEQELRATSADGKPFRV
jgi:hypothetical protein